MASVLLILHALIGTALLGAITHQVVSALRNLAPQTGSFLSRYTAVNKRSFTSAVIVCYSIELILGAYIYPNYRLNVRIPFEEMSLGWAVGLFELKEHFAGIGLMALPFYARSWRSNATADVSFDCIAVSLLLAFIVWWSFLVGHILNNIRGLG